MEIKGSEVLAKRTCKDVSLAVLPFSVSGLLPDDIYIVQSNYIDRNIYDMAYGGTINHHWSTAGL
jgi:hypothetical protein